jgi:hypothetical protein
MATRGAVGYIRKPFDILDVLAIVERYTTPSNP